MLAGVSRSKVTVLNVISLPPGTSPKTVEALKKDLSTRSTGLLDKAKRMGKSEGIDVETMTVETSQSIVMAIVEFAGKEKTDLIVMGTKGTSGYGRLMLGSVAAGVVSFAGCPVLAVR
jgi:nucleotide-binding universal stress UspA family protein